MGMLYELDEVEKAGLLDTVVRRARMDLNDGRPLTEMAMTKTNEDTLDSQEFYELMQTYRHADRTDQCAVVAAFETVKEFVRRLTGKWQPIETCPDNTTVMFWDRRLKIGRMEHDVLRMGGFKQDHFWGGPFDDDVPPTGWMPLPQPPVPTRNGETGR